MCNACQQGKQAKSSFQPKNVVSTSRPLELLHMDLFGLTKTQSLGSRRYGLLLLIIFQDIRRYSFQLIKMRLLMFLKSFVKRFKMKKVCAYQALEVIMVENLKITFLKLFVKKMRLVIIFHVLELLNKMGQWKEKVEL